MATITKIAMFVAGAHFVALASPSAAFAQEKPATADVPMTAPMPGASPSAESQVWVHLQGSEAADLQQDTAGDRRHWVTVCSAPCDRSVSTGFAYRIAGDGIRNSRVFSLRAQGGDRETIVVDEGSSAGLALGIVSTSVGGVVMFLGLFLVLVNSITDSLAGASDHSGQETGWVLAGVGLGGVVGGVVAIASNVHTGVTQGPASSPAAWLRSGGGASGPTGFTGALKDASKDARRDAGLDQALPPVVGIPLFGGSF